MSTDHNEAMRLADVCEDESRSNPDDYRWQAAALLRQQAERIAELEGERDRLRAEVDRTGNNRDMWKDRCGRQVGQLEQLRAEVERLRANAERWEYALNSEEFAVCEWGSVFGEPCWVPISEESAIDAARTQKDEG